MAASSGRASRTALLGLLTAGVGSDLFGDVADPWLTALPFVLVVLGTSALSSELTRQAQRGDPEWARTDTAIMLILLGYAALLGVALAVSHMPGDERTAAACFAVLYVLFAGYFWWVRRRALA